MHTLNTAEDAARLLTMAQERIGQQVRFVETEPNRWCAMFKDGGFYQLEWSQDWARLMLIAELGDPPPQHERAALSLALSYNAQWRQVGNLRMARQGERGALLLIGELDPESEGPDDVCTGLLHFEGLRRWWGEALTHFDDDLAEPPMPSSRFLRADLIV